MGNKGKVSREVWRQQPCHLMDVDLGSQWTTRQEGDTHPHGRRPGETVRQMLTFSAPTVARVLTLGQRGGWLPPRVASLPGNNFYNTYKHYTTPL